MNDQPDIHPAPAVPPGPTTDAPRPSPQTSRRRRRWWWWLAALVVLGLAALLGWRLAHRGAAPAAKLAGGPPVAVSVATIGTGDIDIVLRGLGAVTPLATVTVRTQINGILQQLAFTEGQIVHRNQFLAQIDPRPYQVSLESAQGSLAHDEGLLEQARADSQRYQMLSRQNSIAQQQAQDQLFLIKQYQGSVITDQAAIDSAKLNLVYCHITSPVEGRVGIRLVDPGNYVQTTDTTGLFVLTQLQPISVLFTLPEDVVDAVQAQMAAHTLQVTAYDRSDTRLLATGTLATTDNQIDNTTGTVELRAMFANADDGLFPQQFVNAHLLLQTLKGVVVAPQAAVQHGAPGDFVYLVRPQNVVAVQPVKTGPAEGERVQIVQGLKPGDRVVTDGLDRLRDGSRIVVPSPKSAPGRMPGGAPGTAPARPPAGAGGG